MSSSLCCPFVSPNNLRYRGGKCTETLECPELVVDISFELNGKYIAVCLERTGVYLYSSRTFELACQLTCDLPTPRSVWTSFACIPHRTFWQAEKCVKSYIQVLMSTSDAALYSAFVEDLPGEADRLRCHSFVTFPLPPRLDGLLSLVYIGCADATSAPRVLALGKAGDLLVLQTDHVHEQSPGYLTIVADLGPDLTQQSSFNAPSTPVRIYPQRCIGRQLCGAAGEHVVLIGSDGAARMFKLRAMVMPGSGSLQGQRLSAAPPGAPNPVVNSQITNAPPPAAAAMRRVGSAQSFQSKGMDRRSSGSQRSLKPESTMPPAHASHRGVQSHSTSAAQGSTVQTVSDTLFSSQ